MKSLRMNPQDYDIELGMTNDIGTTLVDIKFGDTSGQACFTPKEMERVGRWFIAAAKAARIEMKKSKETEE